MDFVALSDKDVNRFLDGAGDFIGIIFGAVLKAVDSVPQTLLGFVVVVSDRYVDRKEDPLNT